METLFDIMDTITEKNIYSFALNCASFIENPEKYIQLKPAESTDKKTGLKVQNSKQFYIHVKSTLILTIRHMNKGTFIEISAYLPKERLPNLEYALSNNKRTLRYSIQSNEDLELFGNVIQHLIVKALKNVDFDCCSRYKECSTIGQCVSTTKDFPMLCSYADKLRNGINFFK